MTDACLAIKRGTTVPDHSPFFPTAAEKRSAEETLTNDNKRLAPTVAYPSIGKEEAETLMKSFVLPKQPKKQSHYVRFKSLMLQDAKDAGDTETIKNITSLAKDSWNMVKNARVNDKVLDDNNSNESVARIILLRLKRRALLEEKQEVDDYNKKVTKFKTDFLDSAMAFMFWKTEDISNSNYRKIEEELIVAHGKAATAWGSEKEVPPQLKAVYKNGMDKISEIKKEAAIEGIVLKLRFAPLDILTKHAQEHYALQEKAWELDKVKTEAESLLAEKHNVEAQELQWAYKIKPDVCRELKKQLVYTNANLKKRSIGKRITYKRGGVSPKVFAKAFGVAEGTKQVTFPGSEVGSKPLRYGACLVCGDVTVKHHGEDITASTSYMLEKSLSFF